MTLPNFTSITKALEAIPVFRKHVSKYMKALKME